MTPAQLQADKSLVLAFPSEALEALAQRTAEILREEVGATRSPWLTREQAAEYLSVPLSRLEKDRTLPVHRWGGRVFYNRRELDEYLLGLGAFA